MAPVINIPFYKTLHRLEFTLHPTIYSRNYC